MEAPRSVLLQNRSAGDFIAGAPAGEVDSVTLRFFDANRAQLIATCTRFAVPGIGEKNSMAFVILDEKVFKNNLGCVAGKNADIAIALENAIAEMIFLKLNIERDTGGAISRKINVFNQAVFGLASGEAVEVVAVRNKITDV